MGRCDELVSQMIKCNHCHEEKPLEQFHKRANRPTGHQGHCKACNLKQVQERREAFKQQCLEYLGGECQVCGYRKCANALEFHHRDPTKDFVINKGTLAKFENVKEELDKCALLCANCHREVHAGLISL